MTKKINDGLTNSQRHRLNHPELKGEYAKYKSETSRKKRIEIITLLGRGCPSLDAKASE